MARAMRSLRPMLAAMLVVQLIVGGANDSLGADPSDKTHLDIDKTANDFASLFVWSKDQFGEDGVQKLRDSVSYGIFTRSPALSKHIGATFDSIAEHTNLRFYESASRDRAEIMVGFVTSPDDFEKAKGIILKNNKERGYTAIAEETGQCLWTALREPSNRAIKRLVVVYFIKDQIIDESIDCVNNALWRFTGPINRNLNSDRARVFAEDSTSGKPTDYEKLLISLLYNDRLKSGMDRDSALTVVRELLKRHGTNR